MSDCNAYVGTSRNWYLHFDGQKFVCKSEDDLTELVELRARVKELEALLVETDCELSEHHACGVITDGFLPKRPCPACSTPDLAERISAALGRK